MSGNRGLNQLLMLALKRGFTLVCIFATLITAIWQFYTYGKGEDQTQVEYKHFNEAESDIYPSIALCVTTAVNEERLKEYGANFTAEQYVAFLQGQHWDQSMLKVDYEKCCKHFWALGVVVLYYILLAVMGGSIGHGAINFSVFIE